MKASLLFSVLVGLTSILIEGSAQACSPAPKALVQNAQIYQVLSSNEYLVALDRETYKDFNISIESIRYEGAVIVTLSSGCVIQAKVLYSPPEHNGACPVFKGVSVNTVCPAPVPPAETSGPATS